MNNQYIFTSARLGFRNWSINDLDDFAEINANPQVMEHFPSTLTKEETTSFIHRLQAHFNQHQYNYFAVEILETKELIGFIGLAYQIYETTFNPCTDIGWRLKPSAWGNGYATEGAKRCLDYAFNDLNLNRIVAVCTLQNTPSENVMKKIGMQKKGVFKHPKLKDYPVLENCVWYEINF